MEPQLIVGDALTFLPGLEAGSVALAFLDTPFNIGLKYAGYHDNLPEAVYRAWLGNLFSACRRVLSPTGAIWVQMGVHYQAQTFVLLQEAGFHWRNTVSWTYSFGPHQKRKFSPCWTALHYFVMDPERFTFNDDAIRIPSARQTVYGDKRANPKGRVPSDVWDFSRVCGTFKERVKGGNGKGHPCQTPEAVLERIILACSNPGDTVLDPVCGTGTTLAVARRLGRRSIGIELSEETAALARQRLESP